MASEDAPPPLPTVVRIRRRRGAVVQGCDVYIGRRATQGGWALPESVWANPYGLRSGRSREESLALYEQYVRSRPGLLEALPNLAGKRIGCWCTPQPCHGDVLVRIFQELTQPSEG